MRQIKFRVWNGFEMEYDVTVGRFGAFYVNPEAGDGLDPNDSASLTSSNTKYDEGTPVMQFTGLKDKNGKEIYEGDVIEFNWNPILNEPSELFTFREQLKYYEGWGCFTMHLQSSRLKDKQRDLFHEYALDEVHVAIGSPIMYGSGVAVIGNIHENPELTEATNA